jgi:hypothetical protein
MSPISKPLLALLLASTVLSLLVLMQPESATQGSAADDLLAERRTASSVSAFDKLQPWRRKPHEIPQEHLGQGFVPPPPPPLPPPPPVVVVAPPKPEAPQVSFTYLGRIVRDGRTYIFLGIGEDVQVAAVGDTVEGVWRIEGVTEHGVEFKYLPLNESRQLAMGEN